MEAWMTYLGLSTGLRESCLLREVAPRASVGGPDLSEPFLTFTGHLLSFQII